MDSLSQVALCGAVKKLDFESESNSYADTSEDGRDGVMGMETVPPLPPTYTTPRDKKRPKKGAEGKQNSANLVETNPLAKSAASLKDDSRA
jgi:hypothetical protein